jgi:hypothetical protein
MLRLALLFAVLEVRGMKACESMFGTCTAILSCFAEPVAWHGMTDSRHACIPRCLAEEVLPAEIQCEGCTVHTECMQIL